MLKSISLALAFLISASAAVVAQKRSTLPSKAELAEITERGHRLAEYDVAAWHATDAVLALSPAEGSVTRYIARKVGDGWTVAFGRFNEKRDKFLISTGTVPRSLLR